MTSGFEGSEDTLPNSQNIDGFCADLGRLQDAIATVFKGPTRAVDLLLTTFLAGGHVLLEDIPGVGKTTLGRSLAATIGGRFRRLQCTPDLMPADITGVSIYEEHERTFVFHAGPVFCDVLLADELNRTPPRTQAALLEAMSECQVTVDGESHPLHDNFFCVATQNPLDHVGTYPLPDSQRDRFLLCFGLGYPEQGKEIELLRSDGAEASLDALDPVLSSERVGEIRRRIRQVEIEDSVREYLMAIIAETRRCKTLLQGASPRAALGLQRASQAHALLRGRTFVTPDDIQGLLLPALCHRVSCKAGQDPAMVLAGLLENVPVPR